MLSSGPTPRARGGSSTRPTGPPWRTARRWRTGGQAGACGWHTACPTGWCTGGWAGYAISGGAPLGVRLGHFFRGIGITVLEGYGLTETSAAATVNLPHAQKIGSVRPPLPGVEIRVADDGEILIEGPIVFQGYWRNEQKTREIRTADGWLLTGDLGSSARRWSSAIGEDRAGRPG